MGPPLIVNPRRMVLEPATHAYLERMAALPRLDFSVPADARRVVDRYQSALPATKVVERWVSVGDAQARRIPVRIVTRPGAGAPQPVLIYVHGGGWVFGGAHSHDRLVRELAVRTGAAVVFPVYDLAPEAPYPVALEEICAVIRWVAADGPRRGYDSTRVALCGDGVGATLAIAAILRDHRLARAQVKQLVAFCPVTDASCSTESYRMFGVGYHLGAAMMRWCWDQYLPDGADRTAPTISPGCASADDIAGFPPSLIITAEADVVRDEGESFAANLLAARVPTTAVRYDAAIHGFAVIDALRHTNAANAAIAQAVSTLTAAFG